ncbi:FAD:protein FMN transferase [Alloalcanivorax venustensis]|jgi:thiamine biosynthesis lipoprotein|uniref:FAD:protein FMN transferase n=2 Tax=Alcanivoracaceae TaxID=224372 RepID=UPI000E8A71F7|nr:FAD:protein FMN transferase [Alcanivorax sp.]MED5602484.1 FAD:protein FMN transferase [Pseudomonadota bacterium]MTI51671.1 FAD:protein FMN transferase [Alcanivorax sp.]HAD44325.1 thiamine biosynthesis protein ApbE [Alcanivorax sp.]HBU65365.1 thiamine biosynthesis protein ApbE [Alcanivorax sp.]|tara:strand:+ start:4221 stop:5249 length:1029 start_codon:yes stop_codon:yes gene_type:complete
MRNPLLRFSLLLVAFALLTACDDTTDRLSQLSGPTMGTSWSVKFTGTPENGVPALKSAIESSLEDINQEMSTYLPDSAISRFNGLEAGGSLVLPSDFAMVLDEALGLAEATDGAYDVTVGPLVNLWGFGPDPERFEPPAAEDIEAARRRVGWHKLKLDDRTLTQPGGVYLDLSSIAKGFAVDKLAHLLEKAGISNYLVEIGGELRASGTKPQGLPWRVAVERPIPGVREVEKVVPLRDLAIASSGDYRNFFEKDGKLYSHTLDPRTGRPVEHKLGSVTVLHSSCATADGLATALTVLGPEKGLAFAEERELAVLFIVRTDDGVEEVMTPAFEALLESREGGN